jgi:hypothetical protein
VNFGIENWTHAFSKNGPTHVTIAIVAWDMRSRRMLPWNMILAAAREMFYESTGRVHSTSENTEPGMPTKILAFMLVPPGRPVVEGK